MNQNQDPRESEDLVPLPSDIISTNTSDVTVRFRNKDGEYCIAFPETVASDLMAEQSAADANIKLDPATQRQLIQTIDEVKQIEGTYPKKRRFRLGVWCKELFAGFSYEVEKKPLHIRHYKETKEKEKSS